MLARVTGIAGATILLAGALWAAVTPLHLYSVDRSGAQIFCGNGLHPSYRIADEEDQLNLVQYSRASSIFAVSNYAEQCAALVHGRQAVAVPMASAGVVLLMFVLVFGLSSRPL